MPNPTRILITGSNGLTGSKLVQLFAGREGIQLLAVSKSADKIKGTNGYQFESMDITHPNEVDTLVQRFLPTHIINTAALTQTDLCEKEQELCWKTNVMGVENILNAIKNTTTHLIHLSTDLIFNGKKGLYSESDTPSPLSFYGYSKWTAERKIMESKIKYSILRTVMVYGTSETISRSNFLLLVKENLEKNKTLQVVTDQFRTPTLAEDFIEGIRMVYETGKTGVFHIAGAEYISIFNFAEKIAEVFGLDKNLLIPVTTEFLNPIAPRPLLGGFNISKAINELEYKPKTLAEGLNLVKKQLS